VDGALTIDLKKYFSPIDFQSIEHRARVLRTSDRSMRNNRKVRGRTRPDAPLHSP
jgi:hypothetical protein